jgi:hypothetical protein
MKLGVLLKVEKLIKTNINLASGCFLESGGQGGFYEGDIFTKI